MMTGLSLHVRRLESGRLVATLLPFTDLSFDGDSLSEVRSAARRAGAERLEELSGVLRAGVVNHEAGELHSVPVRVCGKTSSEPVTITVGLVLYSRGVTTGSVYVAYAPGVPRWSVVGSTQEQTLASASESLQKTIKHWSPGSALALDSAGEVELEWLSLEPEPESKSERSPRLPIPGDDMVELSRQGRLGRLDRRDPLVERALAALAAEGRASVLLVGPADVGKTALLHEIAARLANGDMPPALKGRRLVRTSANELIAGARFTGMWQERARQLINFARNTGAIIALGDPGGIVDAGRWSESDNNLGRVLRPYVERGEIRLICEATDEGVARARKLEPSFIEVFYRVEVPEPGIDATRGILRAATRRIKANHDVAFDDDAVEAVLSLTVRFEPYRALPGKAVRLLEETAQLFAADSSEVLGREEVTSALAQRSGMPLTMLSDRVALRVQDVRAFFEERVLGQPEAVEAVVDLVAVIKSALNDPSKPLSSLFFVGPTGVGKTELSKALAEFLFGSRDRVLRFDMAEYATGDAVARLTGSAWDRRTEGELVRRVREQPFCVVLLDELEKAHRSVFDVLLPALGEGRLTDASGQTADLRNAIVIMTSNLGAARQDSASIGFAPADAGGEHDRRRAHFVEEAERFFRPEFFNRIDQVLAFDPLDEETIRKIARRELGRLLLREGITRRKLLVEIGDGVVESLAAAGFHPRYGARPLHREIERAVIRPLARLLVDQQPDPGALIRLERHGDDVKLTVERIYEPAPAPAGHRRRSTETAQDATLAKAAASAKRLLGHVLDEQTSVAAAALGEELSGLVEQMNGPGFWDDPAAAQHTLTRIYHLQQVTDGLLHLRNRSEGLVELAEQLRANRDRGRLSELREALEETEEELTIAKLECAGAAAGEADPDVLISLIPVSADADKWAEQLAAMYTAWAQRTGREVSSETDGLPRLKIRGPGTLSLLSGEGGLHRHDLPSRQRTLVRVTVTPAGQAPHTPESSDGLAQVVRVYSEGSRTEVRDPRTGVRLGNVNAVLEGRIDEFILAAVRSNRQNETHT